MWVPRRNPTRRGARHGSCAERSRRCCAAPLAQRGTVGGGLACRPPKRFAHRPPAPRRRSRRGRIRRAGAACASDSLRVASRTKGGLPASRCAARTPHPPHSRVRGLTAAHCAVWTGRSSRRPSTFSSSRTFCERAHTRPAMSVRHDYRTVVELTHIAGMCAMR